jgi:hypothetical protein
MARAQSRTPPRANTARAHQKSSTSAIDSTSAIVVAAGSIEMACTPCDATAGVPSS